MLGAASKMVVFFKYKIRSVYSTTSQRLWEGLREFYVVAFIRHLSKLEMKTVYLKLVGMNFKNSNYLLNLITPVLIRVFF